MDENQVLISIHVPSWGTTIIRGDWSGAMQDFNPRSLVGNDLDHLFTDGADRNFNPRSLVGNDKILQHTIELFRISIHVPSWGTTVPVGLRYHLFSYFNPRSLVGNDCIKSSFL